MIAGETHALERASELDDGGLLRILETIAVEPRFVVQLDLEAEALVLAAPHTGLPLGRVADEVAIAGRTLKLARRGQAVGRAVSPDRPVLWTGSTRFTVLSDRGGRHLVVLEPEAGERIVLLGDLLDRRLIDVLPGG